MVTIKELEDLNLIGEVEAYLEKQDLTEEQAMIGLVVRKGVDEQDRLDLSVKTGRDNQGIYRSHLVEPVDQDDFDRIYNQLEQNFSESSLTRSYYENETSDFGADAGLINFAGPGW